MVEMTGFLVCDCGNKIVFQELENGGTVKCDHCMKEFKILIETVYEIKRRK